MKIIIVNWKMNPVTLDEALGLFDFYLSEMQKYQNIQLVVCPPLVYLEELYKRQETRDKRQVSLGAQDLFWEKSGPSTGEISTEMLNPAPFLDRPSAKLREAQSNERCGVKNFGVTYVLVGHSDRRYKIGLPGTTLDGSKVVLGESDEVINKKIKAALEAGIIPVLLVGERNQGDDRKAILEQQLSVDLAGLTADQISKVLITYEPVWAISTTPGAEPDTPASTLEAIKIIDSFLTSTYNLAPSTYFYGGSVNSQNVADFLRHPELSGTVIGGASLRKKEFAIILEMVNNIK